MHNRKLINHLQLQRASFFFTKLELEVEIELKITK